LLDLFLSFLFPKRKEKRKKKAFIEKY
jgi:hypothetical protein